MINTQRLFIQAIGDYYERMDPDQGPTLLKEVLDQVCRERFRRIDRYTQLALIGSARCAGDRELSGETGLYIGSRFAALGSTVKVHEQMVAGGNLPKPADFINTLSNSAGYYVARNLRLGGRNLFVSREDASLVAALQLASLDLGASLVSQALVGVVDESAIPVEQHCRRLGVPGDTPLGEGSHWFLISANQSEPDGLAELSHLATLQTSDATTRWVEQVAQGSGGVKVWWPEQDPDLPREVAHLERFRANLACYPGAMGAAAARYLDTGCQAPLLLLARDGAGRCNGVCLTPP